jgi:hypothetical protein
MKVLSIMPICARNRPDASLPGCYNQPDPLSSCAVARIRFQKSAVLRLPAAGCAKLNIHDFRAAPYSNDGLRTKNAHP